MKTLLQSSHFESTTRFRNGGIQLDYRITRAERALFASAGTKSGDESRETRVVINPTLPSLVDLRSLMLRGSRDAGEAYDTKWIYDEKAEGESQKLVVVAYDGDAPIGYSSFRIHVGHAPGRKTIRYRVALGLIYVDTRYRGRGFGTDLSCATGLVCAEVLHALLNAAPKSSEIRLVLHADFVSAGSAVISRSIRDAIEFAREMADDPRCQKEIIFDAA